MSMPPLSGIDDALATADIDEAMISSRGATVMKRSQPRPWEWGCSATFHGGGRSLWGRQDV